MSCTLSVFAADAVVRVSRSAWHATYEDVLVLERRHSSEVLGLDSVHLLYPRVRSTDCEVEKCAFPCYGRSVRHAPKIHFRKIQVISTPTKLQGPVVEILTARS
jgi:hypothetical protein